jgi:heptosyltransferase-2
MSLLLWVRIPTLLALWWSRLRSKRIRKAATEPRSFIVFRLDALGDLVLTTPLFRELKRSFPAARITVVAQAAYRSVLITNPHIDELLELRPVTSKWLPANARGLVAAVRFYWRELRTRSFDVAISPRWDTDEHLATMLCTLTRAGRRIGYSECTSPGKRKYNRGFARAFDLCLEPGPLRHEVLRNLAIVEALGGKVSSNRLEIRLSECDRDYARQTLRTVSPEEFVVALGIGAQSPGRRWPLERYAECIATLAAELPIKAVITCAPGEHREAECLAASLPTDAIISDSAEIRETCALLELCDLFIGNDTGAAHLAAAMNCPTLVISRHPRNGDPAHPNSPVRFAPYCAESRVLQPERGLDGCADRCRHIGPHCIRQISVSEVVAAASEMLLARAKSSALCAEASR